MADKESNKPLIVLRDGPLKASMWENEGENGSFLSTTFAKTYTKDGVPKDGRNFSQGDLLPLSELARKAYHKAVLHRSHRKSQEAEPANGG